jgi:hypothetical protein
LDVHGHAAENPLAFVVCERSDRWWRSHNKRGGGNLRRKIIVALLSVTVALATTASAFAHDCFNPNKPEGAGVNYTVVGFNQNGPILEQTGPGKGIGGFAALSPDLTEGQTGLEVHTLGSGASGKEEVGGPGSQKPGHACDGKGIDYLSACASG